MKQKKVDPSKMLGALRMVIMLIVIALIAFSGIKVIPTTDNGIVTRFGKYTNTLSPGLNFVIPFVDQVYKVPVKTVQKAKFHFK